MSQDGSYTHATVVLVGEAGVLIRGASGSGKSALALALMAEAERQGLFTRLVGDDRVRLSARAGRLSAQGHPAVAGLIEERGTGLLPVPHESMAIIRCIVDLAGKLDDPTAARLPSAEARHAAVCGVDLPRLAITSLLDAQEGARRILSLLAKTR